MTRAYLSNIALRMFLERVGAAYDRMRKLDPYGNRSFETIRNDFGGCCCYCEIPLTASNATEDHLVGVNKSDIGLHAWGNVVPACGPCNNRKNRTEWRAFLRSSSSTDEEFNRRASRIQEFRRKYRYAPGIGLEIVAASLYEEVGALVVGLIDQKIKSAEAVIARLADIEPRDGPPS